MTDKTLHKIAIIQSGYIPWKGYFDIINLADEFILLDDVQFTRRDWRNRNLIKTPQGPRWMTIPVKSSGNYYSNINEITTSNQIWRTQHWNLIQLHYSQAPFFPLYSDRFKLLYLDSDENNLSRINFSFISEINQILGISTRISWSDDYGKLGNKTERLMSICKQAGGSKYISGPSARSYLDEKLFIQAGIELEWMDYNGYPTYKQMYGPFEHHVSILDLIFNEGPDATRYMKSFSTK